jgi:nucleotide-binding universal stress UspA family protein
MTRVDKPVIVVPPDAVHPGALRRVLVPTEGRPDGTHALTPLLERLTESGMRVTALHVDDDSSLPSYSDQPQHETEVFAREFVARNLPPTIDVELALRVGKPGSEVLEACDQATTDLVAVAWSRSLSPGRARVVRQLLERSHVPVLLVPEAAPEESRGPVPQGRGTDPQH